jgi:hypothetical protein
MISLGSEFEGLHFSVSIFLRDLVDHIGEVATSLSDYKPPTRKKPHGDKQNRGLTKQSSYHFMARFLFSLADKSADEFTLIPPTEMSHGSVHRNQIGDEIMTFQVIEGCRISGEPRSTPVDVQHVERCMAPLVESVGGGGRKNEIARLMLEAVSEIENSLMQPLLLAWVMDMERKKA